MRGPQGFRAYEFEWQGGQPVAQQVVTDAETVLAPGFVDIHIHGAFGFDFMSASRSQVVELSEMLREVGYEAWLPTTVTGSAEQIRHALDQLPDHPMVRGFHLEGPFISPVFPGAQPPSFILDPASRGPEWDHILNDPRLRVITMAGERPGAPELIRQLAARGVIVSMGHTDATFDQCAAAVDAGARHTTHTYNAMRGLHHREPGTVGAALADPRVTCELIYDRVHVAPGAAKVLLAAKGKDLVIAVSDSTMATGLPPGKEITMWNLRCITSPGEIRLAENGALAGSAIHLLDAFQRLGADFGPETAIALCSENPRRAVGMNHPPHVWLEFDLELNLRQIRNVQA